MKKLLLTLMGAAAIAGAARVANVYGQDELGKQVPIEAQAKSQAASARIPGYTIIGDYLNIDEDGYFQDVELEVSAGKSITLPEVTLRDSENRGGNIFTDAEFIYMFADDNYEPWYDEDGNPVTSNDELSVDMHTGVVTAQRGVEDGFAYIIPVATDATTEKYEIDETQVTLYIITVVPSAGPEEGELTYGGDGSNHISISSGETYVVPTPVLTVGGEPVEGVTYTYTVVDPATGEPFADGDAPVTVDPVSGEVTAVDGKSGVAKIVVSTSDDYVVTPIEYFVTVSAPIPTTPTGPFAEEYIRVNNLDDVKGRQGFIMVSTDARSKHLTWLTGFEVPTTGGNCVGLTVSAAVLGSSELPEKLPAAWLAQQTAPAVMHITPSTTTNLYIFYLYKGEQKKYMSGNGGAVSMIDAASQAYGIEADKVIKEVHGNSGFGIYPNGSTSIMSRRAAFTTDGGITFFSYNVPNNMSGDNRAYPEFYRVVYEDTRFDLTAGSHADLYKLVGGALVKVQTLTEGENLVDLMTDTDVRVFYIVPTDNTYLTTVGFPDGTSATTFEAMDQYGMNVDGYKIVIGAAYGSYSITSVPRQAVEVTLGGETSGSVVIAAGSENTTVPAPKLRDAEGNLIEGATYIYEVVDAEGNPFAEGEAPITVDPATGEIAILKPGQAFVKVSLTGDAAKTYDAAPATYEVNVTTPAAIELGDNETSVVLPEGTEGASVPTPALKNPDGSAIEEAVKYVYEVVDAEGNPFPEGEAPIAVDEEGNITILKPGQAFVKVSLSDEDAKRYGAEPAMYEVVVPAEGTLSYAGGDDSAAITIGSGETATVPVPVLTVGDQVIENVTYKYTIVNPATGEPYAEGEAPVAIDENGNIVPVEGKAGVATIVVSLSDEDAKFYTVPSIEYVVAVSAPAAVTATGPFATEYVRVENLDEVKGGERFIMVSTDARDKHLTWLIGFGDVTIGTSTSTFGLVDSAAVLTGTALPAKIPVAWIAQQTAPLEMQIAAAPTANKYYISYYANGARSYLSGTGGAIIPSATASTQYTIEAAKTVKEEHGNYGFVVYPGNNKTMFAKEKGHSILSNNNVNNVGSTSRAYPEFYRVVYEPTLFTLAAGSNADLYKVVEGSLVKVATLAEGDNKIDLGAHPDAEVFYIVPTEHNYLTSVSFTDGSSVTEDFDSLIEHGMQGHGYKIVFGAAYASYAIATEMPDAMPAQITFTNGSTGESVNIPAGKVGDVVPTPVLTDDEDEPIEGVTFKYTVIDPATGEPFAEGEAPVTVDENGNITTVPGKTGEAQIVVSLSDKDSKLYDAQPVIYDVNVTKPDVVAGINGEQDVDLHLGHGDTTDLPGIKFTTVDDNGNVTEIPGVTYTYEVINPATGEPYAEGEAPVTVDPATGKITATDNSGDAQIKVTANGYDAEPLYIDVTVDNFRYVKLQRITDPSTIKAGDPVVFVSSRPISGKGFVSSSSDTESLGIETGTTGNMPPVSVLPGQTELPDELVLTTEQADALRMFSIVSNGSGYGFQIKNGVKFGTGQYIRSEKNDRIRYLNNQIIGYNLTPKAEGVYAPQFGNYYLNFNASGILTSFTSNLSNANGADIVFYSVVYEKASISFENGSTGGSVSIPSGKTGESVPTPVLTDSDDEPIADVTFKYTVIDPATGEPFAEGEAPISVDENGNITTVPGKTGDAQVVITLSDDDANLYDAEPIFYEVTVTNPTVITGANGEEEIGLQIGNGDSTDLPGMKVETVDPETGEMVPVAPVTYVYEIINPGTGEPYAEGEAPVTVDPATGKVTATDNSGEAQIKVTIAEDPTAEPLYIDVTVKDYTYVKLQRITDVSAIKAGDPVVFVSSRPISGKGFVSASSDTESLGIETGTTGNMPPVSVLPGQTVLPDELVLTTEQADALRMFSIVSNGSGYGFQIKNGVKFGTGQYIRSEKNDRIRYLNNQVIGYNLTPKAEGVYAPQFGNYYLNFNGDGILTSFTSNLSNANGGDIVFYSVQRQQATIALENGSAGGSVSIPAGKTGESVPTPVLTATDEDGNQTDIEGVTFKYTVIDPATGEPFAEGEAPITVDEDGNITTVEGKTGEAQIVISLSDESAMTYDADPIIYNVKVTTPGSNADTVTYRKVNSVEELHQLAADNAGIIVVSARTFDDKGFVAASTTTDAHNNFLPVSILDGESELPAEFSLSRQDADQLLSVYTVKQGDHFGFKLPAGHYLKRTINNKIMLTTDFHGYEVSDHKAVARAKAADNTGRAAESNDGFRVMSGDNYLGFVENGNLSHQNTDNVFTNGAAPAFYTINKVKAAASFEDGSTTTSETVEKGKSTTIPEVNLTTEEDGKTVTIDGVKYKYEVVDSEGNPIPAATSPISIDPATGEITAVKGGDARVKITPADNAEMIYDAEPAYIDITVPASDAKLVVDGKDTGSITLSDDSTDQVTVPTPTLVDADGTPIETGNLTYSYEVVDANGNPFPEGQAPISVDENGNVTVKPGAEGQAYVRVSLTGDAADEYHADPYTYEVVVKHETTDPVITLGEDNTKSMILILGDQGKSVPAPELSVDGVREEGATFTYTVVDEQGNPFADGQAPISVDPETGDITILKPGEAKVIVELSDESAKHFGVDPAPVTLDVNVWGTQTSIDQIEAAADPDALYFNLNGVQVENPAPGMYIRIRGNKADKVVIK